MTRMEAMKKHGAPKQCPSCRSCQTFERTDKPGIHRCMDCGYEWTLVPSTSEWAEEGLVFAVAVKKTETVAERLARLECEYKEALADDSTPVGRAKEIREEMGEIISSATNGLKEVRR